MMTSKMTSLLISSTEEKLEPMTGNFTPAEPLDAMQAPDSGTLSAQILGLQNITLNITPAIVRVLIVDDFIGSRRS